MSTCTAQRKGGRGQCGANAVLGTNVCRVHGGNAPQVRRRAAQRLLEASDAAAAYLVETILDKSKPDAIRLVAARDLLDRAGLSAKQQVELEIGPAKEEPLWLSIIPDILVAVPTSDPAATTSAGELIATVVPTGIGHEQRSAAHDAEPAAPGAVAPQPVQAHNWVSRQDGPRPRKTRKR